MLLSGMARDDTVQVFSAQGAQPRGHVSAYLEVRKTLRTWAGEVVALADMVGHAVACELSLILRTRGYTRVL
jgi:hypothetical protein